MKIQISSALALGALLIVACSKHSKAPSSEEKAIIGTNDFIVEKDDALRQLVGKLSLLDTACTAFVTGPNEITTAAHCIQLKDDLTNLTFTTAADKSTSITNIIDLEPTKDRLILGTEITFEHSLSMGTIQDNSLKLVGYDSTKNELFSNAGCQFEKRIAGSGAFSHSCDTIAGMSGSPILQQGKVVGIHLGYIERIDRNAAYEVALANDPTKDVASIGVTNEWGHVRFDSPHVRIESPHIRNVLPDIPSFSSLQDGIIRKLVVTAVVNVGPKAERDGWTKAKCAGYGTSSILAAVTPTYAAICAAAGLATAGTAVAPCSAWIAGVGGLVVGATCTSLCNDHKLQDCKRPS